ncbi:hypothetical protein PHET_08858 [Paragonimus heterotremus]|uniref:Uncharacterized protein n=1 Tax=Paragonimus heterotremus TaxID=100268 RepID=A0A8J4T3Q4_9TREM|nr:hypothetical protein PHET_08858 [Paragonimus heterotremus]
MFNVVQFTTGGMAVVPVDWMLSETKRTSYLEVPTLSSSSPSPKVQSASVSTVQAGTTSIFPKPPPVNLGNIATIRATNTSDNVVIGAAVLDRANERSAFLTAKVLEGANSQMRQTVFHPAFAKQVNYTGINQKIASRDGKTLANMRAAEAGDRSLLAAAIRTWLKRSRDRGVARRQTKRCSEHTLVT